MLFAKHIGRGVFRGTIGPWPPLWVARIAKLHRKVSEIEACPPPSQVGHQGLESKSPDIGQKMGRNLSEDLFFALHLILGEKWGEIWVKTFYLFFLLFTWFWAKNGPFFMFYFCSTPFFGRKMERNLSEDLFFFCSSPDSGRKMGRNLRVTISNSDLRFSQIFWSFWTPLFKILRTLLHVGMIT